METRARYVAVGAFVLVLVTLAFVTVLWLARAQLRTQHAPYDIYFTGAVTGLRTGAPVEYNGVPVGRVIDIRIDPQNVEQIRVTVEIDRSVVIKADAVAGVESGLLSGVAYIEITGGTQGAPELVAQGGQHYPVIPSRRSNLQKLYSRGPYLLERLTVVAEKLNAFLDEPNRDAFAHSLANVERFTGGLADRDKEIGEMIANANKAAAAAASLLRDIDQGFSGNAGLQAKLAQAIADFDHLAKGLDDTNRQLRLALGDLRPGLRDFSRSTLSDVGGLVAEARQLIAGLARLAASIERDPSRVLFGDRREGYRPQ